MITDYTKYVKEIKRLNLERDNLQSDYSIKLTNLNDNIKDVTKELYKNAHIYTESELEKKLKKVNTSVKYTFNKNLVNMDIYLLNDKIGLQIINHPTRLLLQILYKKLNTNYYKCDDTYFEWYPDTESIDQFINDSINGLTRNYNKKVNTEEKREIKKIQRNYNL